MSRPSLIEYNGFEYLLFRHKVYRTYVYARQFSDEIATDTWTYFVQGMIDSLGEWTVPGAWFRENFTVEDAHDARVKNH